jgi:hypothetical protein
MRRRPLVVAAVALLGLGFLSAGGIAAADPVSPPTLAPAATPPVPVPGPSPSRSTGPSPGPSGVPTGPAVHCPRTTGTTIQFCFTYGADRTSWYWKDQHDQAVAVGPLGQRVRLPDPQAADTLPSAVRQGDATKLSAVYFDVLSHGVPMGSRITSFVLRIQEGTAPTGPEQPEFNTQDKVILACPATRIWAAGAAELWDEKPSWSQTGCVKGTPDTSTPPVWTFDLTPIAANWAADPFVSNNGIVFVPRASSQPQEGNYQLNLKVPSRDDTTTPTVNEYDQTKGRTVATVTYAKAGGSHPPAPPPPPPPPAGTGGGSFGGSGGSCCSSGGSGGFGGSGGSTGGTGPVSGGSGSRGGSGSGTTPVTQASPPPIPTVKFPWYVWILLPVGLLGLAAVRSILFEQSQANRPGGAIAAIRVRNAAARGEPSPSSDGGRVVDRIRTIVRGGPGST